MLEVDREEVEEMFKDRKGVEDVMREEVVGEEVELGGGEEAWGGRGGFVESRVAAAGLPFFLGLSLGPEG